MVALQSVDYLKQLPMMFPETVCSIQNISIDVAIEVKYDTNIRIVVEVYQLIIITQFQTFSSIQALLFPLLWLPRVYELNFDKKLKVWTLGIVYIRNHKIQDFIFVHILGTTNEDLHLQVFYQ